MMRRIESSGMTPISHDAISLRSEVIQGRLARRHIAMDANNLYPHEVGSIRA